VLERLIYVMQHEHKVRTSVKAALQYPLLVLGCLTVAFFILLTFVIPRFVRLFEQASITLPLPTRICLALNRLLTAHWYWMIAVVVGVTSFLVFYCRTARGRYVRDSLLLRIPVLGPVLVKAALSRFASIFSILQSSGVPVLDAMKILSNTMGNDAFARQLQGISRLLEEGRGIARPLRSAKYFTPLLINMVAVGEESGNLDGMLREVSNHYDAEVEFAAKKMSDAMGPLLVICLSVLVGFFALAIYMPMWDLTKLVK